MPVATIESGCRQRMFQTSNDQQQLLDNDFCADAIAAD